MSSTSTFVCARCPKMLGTSCCEVKDHEQLATLTAADVHRIVEATGQRPARFTTSEWLTLDEAREYEERRPLYRGYFRHGPARLTLQRRNGACVFHDPRTGCSLPPDAKPTACRLYPFEQWPDGSWSLQVDRFGELDAARASGSACLAVEEANAMDDLLAAFAMTREQVEALGQRIREEVAFHVRMTGPSRQGGR